MSLAVVLTASFAYLLLLFAVAHWADRRARAGRSVIGNAWVYTMSMGVYCTAWTYFGSIGRAACMCAARASSATSAFPKCIAARQPLQARSTISNCST